jgi:hypothetical protein
MSGDEGSKAPFIIYGGIFLIGLSCVSAVLITDCRRDSGYYEEPVRVEPGTPFRAPYPAPEPRAPDWRGRPR